MRNSVLGKVVRKIKNSRYLPAVAPTPVKQRVFGIGCPRTGTTTLGMCFYILGIKETGWDEKLFAEAYSGKIDGSLKLAHQYFGFNDLPWCMLYKQLDKAFPGSKFILTIRKDTPTWLKSFQAHHRKTFGRVLDEQGLPQDLGYTRIWPLGITGYEEHNENVREYFRDRTDDLEILCWEEGDDWAKLCSFLDLPEPSVSFPHLNHSKVSR